MRSEQSIEEVRRSIATVPWERLAHAYHGAWDAPEHLEIFVSSDASNEALSKSIDWMWGSILHQGSLYILRGVQTVVDAVPDFRDSYDDECGSPVEENRDSEPAYEVWVGNPLPTAHSCVCSCLSIAGSSNTSPVIANARVCWICSVANDRSRLATSAPGR